MPTWEELSPTNPQEVSWDSLSATPPKPETAMQAMKRGALESFKQIPQLGYGLMAGAGAVAENVAGEGGLATGVKDFAVRKYQEKSSDIAAGAKENDNFTTAYSKAKDGDIGALGDWLAHGLGYVGGQAVQMAATAGVGSVAGKTLARGAVESVLAPMVEKEAATIAASEAGKALTAEAIKKQAVSNIASSLGQSAAIAASSFGMEGGEIYGDMVSDAAKEGRTLTQRDLLRAGVGTVAAGLLESAEKLTGLAALKGKIPLGGTIAGMEGVGGKVARAGLGTVVAAPLEGAQEYGQTLAEEYGKGKDPFSEEAHQQGINALALGALGGSTHAVIGGGMSSPRPKSITPIAQARPTIEDISKATSVDEAIAAATAAVNATDVTSELTGQIDRANVGRQLIERAQQQAELNDLIASESRDLNTLHAQTLLENQKRQEMDAIYRQSQADLGRTPDQQVAAATAATDEAPTAMQLAMQRAQQKAAAPVIAPPAAQPSPKPAAPAAAGILPGDVGRANGTPFISENGARLKHHELRNRGPYEIVAVEGGYVVRPTSNPPETLSHVQDVAPSIRAETEAAPGETLTPAGSDAKPAAGVPSTGTAAPTVATSGVVASPQSPANASNHSVNAPVATANTPIQAEVARARASKKNAALVEQPVTPPEIIHFGVGNVPLHEGGKPFKTQRAAKDAKKLQPMMRVVAVQGGFALKEKSAKMLEAEAKRAGKLAAGTTGNKGMPQHAHGFIAREGGLSKSTMSDIGMDKNIKVGTLWMFRKDGGMSLEQATEKLIEGGYLKEGASNSDAAAIIKRSVTNPQYTADGWDRIAEAEALTRFEDHLAAQEEAAQNEDFDPFESLSKDGFTTQDDVLAGYSEESDPIKLQVNADIANAESLGIDIDALKEASYEATRNGSERDYFEHLAAAIESAIARSAEDRGENAGSQSDSAREGVGREEEIRQDLIGEAPNASQQAAENLRRQQADREQAQRNAAPTADGFALGMVDSRNGKEVAPGQMEIGQEPSAKATAILDAAEVKGKERIDVLKDVKSGVITPEELKAAYPEKQGSSEFSEIEKDLQSMAHPNEVDGDIGVVMPSGKVEFVALADAVTAAKQAIDEGTRAVPFQIHSKTGIRLGDVDRVLVEMAKKPATRYKYAPLSSIDTPAQGILNAAVERKEAAYRRVQSLRAQVRDGRHDLRVDLIRAESAHRDAVSVAENARTQIEIDANKQGLTTIKPKKRDDGNSAIFSRSSDRNRIGLGGTPESLSVADYLEAAGNGSQRPESFSEDSTGVNNDATPEDAGNQPRYIKGAQPQTGASMAAVKSWVQSLTAKWINPPNIRIVESISDLPVEAPEDVRGLYYRGTVYIVASQVKSRKDVGTVLMHEAVAHHGLRDMLGREGWTKMMSHINLAIKSGNKALKDIRAHVREIYVDEYGNFSLTPNQEADEIAARAVELGIDAETGEFKPGFSFLKSVFAKIAQFLRDLGLNVEFTNLELQGALVNAMHHLESGRRGEASSPAVVAASREAQDRGKNGSVTNPNDVVGNQGGRSADDNSLGASAARQILEAMAQDENAKYALRVIPGEFNGSISVGDILPVSKKWVDGNETNQLLKGTSAARIRTASEKSVLEALRNLGALGKNGPNGYYFGSRVVLIKGDPISSGEDVGESIFKNAEVVGVWSKPTKGLSSIQPNESPAPNSDGAPMFARSQIIGQTNRQYDPAQIKAMENVGFKVEVPTIQERIKSLTQDMGKKMAQGIVDQFAPVKDLDKVSYGLLRLAKGASGAFEAFLKGGKLKLSDGVYDFDDANRGGVLDKLLIPLGGEHHDFLRWVAANRAERLKSEGKENLFSDADIAALKTLSQGTAEFDYMLQHGARAGQTTRDRTLIYADALKTFNEFNTNVLDLAEQSGLIDGASRHLWEHEFYVPFYRVEEDGGFRGMNIKGAAVRQEAFKKLKGGKNELNADLLDNTLMNWAHLLDASAKNRAAKATIEAAERAGIAVTAPQSTIQGMASSIQNKRGVVWFMDGGEKRYSMVDDPYILTAISSLEYAGMNNPVMNAMAAVKHVLTVGVTASPFFKVRNLIRDSVQVIGTGDISYNPAKNITQGWKLTDPKSDAYFRLLAGGGTIHFGSMMEGSEAKRVQALVESGVDDSTILNSDQKVKAFYRKWIEPGVTAYNELGNRGEAVNRAALYDQLVKQGVSHAEASLQARDLMDFSMQGSFATIRFLTQVVPFMNARLQGLYKLGKSAKDDPVRFGIVLGATAALSVGLLAAYADDDEWKKREDWDRNNYWWFKFGGTAFRIPKPFEIGAIATLAERGFELAFDKEMTNKRFMAQVMTLAGDNLSMNPVPQLVKPLLDVYANKDAFTGRPIETMDMERLKSDYRFTNNTSMAARGISTGMNAVSSIFDKEALSPVQVDHMLRGYFGWLGTFVVGASDLLARPASEQPDKATPDYWKVATGGIVSDLRDAPSRYVSQIYTQAREIEQAYGTWKSLVKEGKTAEAGEFFADHRDEIIQHRQIEHIKSAETKLNERIRIIERSNMAPDLKREKIREIQRIKDQRARLAPEPA